MHTSARGDYSYHKIIAQQMKIRNLEQKVESLQNGEALQKANAATEKWRRRYEREAEARRKDAAGAVCKQKKAVVIWQVADDLDEENRKLKELIAKLSEDGAAKDSRIRDLEEQLAACRERSGLNHTNSGTPNSKDPVGAPSLRKRHDYNSRENSDRKPGAQPGHPHHGRPKPEPTKPPVSHNQQPEWMEGDRDWTETDEYVEKLVVSAKPVVSVTPHRIKIWRNVKTGDEAPSVCPEGLSDEVTYDESVKAIVVML